MAGIDVAGGGVPSLTNQLTNTHIFVGDINNEPADVALTLDPNGGTFSLANTGVLTMPNADATTRGLLTAADWVTFNNKQNAINDWTTAFSSAVQATSSWSATNAAANVNAAIRPKGTGAILASVPDGTITGGNARGTNAVDLQLSRNNANQVASGNFSVIVGGVNSRVTANNSFIGAGEANSISASFATIGGGRSNTISQSDATICGGQTNTASGQHSFVGSGNLNTASGQYSAVTGGQSNTASGAGFVGGGRLNSAADKSGVASGESNSIGALLSFIGAGLSNSISGGNNYSFIGAGRGNQVAAQYSVIGGGDSNYNGGSIGVVGGGLDNRNEATYSTIVGGYQGRTNLYGQVSHSSGSYDANTRGQAQAHELIWRRAITGAPVGGTELFLDGASVAAILPATNSVWHGIIDVSAICTATGNGTTVTGDVEATSYKVTIKRIGTNTVLVGTVQEIGTTNADASMSTGIFTIDANNTNESLRIVFTSPTTAGTTTAFRALAVFRGTQIQY
jgi:hypothetical protein